MGSIAKHALLDYKNHDVGDGCATCTYTPLPTDLGRVVNANAYRSFVLTKAAHDLKDPSIAEAAEPNLRFVLRSQNADGSWFYAMDGRRDFIDHFHTCFVLKALVKIHALRPRDDCKRAIEAGLRLLQRSLVRCRWSAPAVREAASVHVYRRELYDYAECINLLTLVAGQQPALDSRLATVVRDVTERWQRADGSFRSRQLLLGWDDVPMHRWAQAQLFNGLCGVLASTPQSRRT